MELSERINKEVELHWTAEPGTHSLSYDELREWADEVAQLEADNADLLTKLDECIAWHEGDDSPRARLEIKIKLLLKLIEYAARVLDNARMYDTAEYLLKEAGIEKAGDDDG